MIALPTDVEWRRRHQTEVNTWLAINGVDPSSLAEDAGICIRNGLIYYDALGSTAAPSRSTQRRTLVPNVVVRTVPLVVGWAGPLEGMDL